MKKKKYERINEVLTINKNGVFEYRWLKPSTIKKREVTRMYHNGKVRDVFSPKLKSFKSEKTFKRVELYPSNKPVRVTLHCKIIYDNITAGKYIPVWKNFYLEGLISQETTEDKVNETTPKLERMLKDKLEYEFFSKNKTLLKPPYFKADSEDYEYGVEMENISRVSSDSVNAKAHYRYSKNGLLKTKEL
jgi:hypothetical protein